MPWCTTCDRYLAPPAVATDGTCPTCRRPVQVSEHAARRTRSGDAPPGGDEVLGPVPWHFKLFLAAFALYLGWRFVELATVLF